LTKFKVKSGAFIFGDKFHRELRKGVRCLILAQINANKITTELLFFEKSLYLRLFVHKKRTVTLYQNYGSSLVEVRGVEPLSENTSAAASPGAVCGQDSPG